MGQQSATDEIAKLIGFDRRGNELAINTGIVIEVIGDVLICMYKGKTVTAQAYCHANASDIVCLANVNGSLYAIAVKGRTDRDAFYEFDNSGWHVRRHGHWVEAWGSVSGTSNTTHTDTVKLPIAFNEGDYYASIAPTRSEVTRATAIDLMRTGFDIYTTISASSAVPYNNKIYVAGVSDSDYAYRTYSDTQSGSWVVNCDTRVLNLQFDGGQEMAGRIALRASSDVIQMPAGEYEIELFCDDDWANYISLNVDNGDDIYNRGIEMFLADNDNSATSSLSGYLCHCRVNNTKLDSKIMNKWPRSNRMVLDETTNIRPYLYCVGDPAEGDYSFNLIPIIRRVR